MNQRMENFPIDQGFLTVVLQFLYDTDAPFSTVQAFVRFLGGLCANEEIFAFLADRQFVEYLQQLPWRYEGEAGVTETVEFCAQAALATDGAAEETTV
jgi:hypothetical protein